MEPYQGRGKDLETIAELRADCEPREGDEEGCEPLMKIGKAALSRLESLLKEDDRIQRALRAATLKGRRLEEENDRLEKELDKRHHDEGDVRPDLGD